MEQSVKDLLDAIWKKATQEFGDPNARRPDLKLQQCQAMLNSIEQLFERHELQKQQAAKAKGE